MHGNLNIKLSRCTFSWTSIYHDVRSPERQFVTMHGHLNISLSRCTVIWTSIYHDARSSERQFITMHVHLNVNLSWCTVIWTSIYHDARSSERQKRLKYFLYLRHIPTNAHLQLCSITYYYSSSACFDYSSDHHQGGLVTRKQWIKK